MRTYFWHCSLLALRNYRYFGADGILNLDPRISFRTDFENVIMRRPMVMIGRMMSRRHVAHLPMCSNVVDVDIGPSRVGIFFNCSERFTSRGSLVEFYH